MAGSKSRTVDEIAHTAADAMMPEIQPGLRIAVVIVSERTTGLGEMPFRTVWRFVNCPDPKIQAQSLREVADLIERTAAEQDQKS